MTAWFFSFCQTSLTLFLFVTSTLSVSFSLKLQIYLIVIWIVCSPVDDHSVSLVSQDLSSATVSIKFLSIFCNFANFKMSSSSGLVDADSTNTAAPNTADNLKVWIPIESDPNLMSNLLALLSLSNHYFIDIPVIDEAEAMGIFDHNRVQAYIFLYDELKNDFNSGDSLVDPLKDPTFKDLFYMKQTVTNSCGSIALFHAFINSARANLLKFESVIGKFYQDSVALSPEDRAKLFASNELIHAAHHNIAEQGNTEVPPLNDVQFHYIALVWHNGHIVQLDGRKPGPIVQGSCSRDSFKTEALQVIKRWLNPESLHYSIMGLCA